MKKLVYGGLFLALVGIGFSGCKKEDAVPQQVVATPEFVASKNLVTFNSIESYENFIDNYDELQKDEAFNLLKSNGFKNYFSKKENLVFAKNEDGSNSQNYEMDDRFGQLLNEDGVIRIGDYLFKVDIAKEEVRVVEFRDSDDYKTVLTLMNSSSKEVLIFSTDDDVLDLLTSGSGEKCGGSASFDINKTIDDQFGGKFRFSARYFKAGIYNRIVIRGIHEYIGFSWSSYDAMKFEVSVDTHWKSLRARRRPCGSGTATYHHGGVRDFPIWSNFNSYPAKHFNVYEGTRALNGYRVWIRGEITINGTKYNTEYFGAITNANF